MIYLIIALISLALTQVKSVTHIALPPWSSRLPFFENTINHVRCTTNNLLVNWKIHGEYSLVQIHDQNTCMANFTDMNILTWSYRSVRRSQISLKLLYIWLKTCAFINDKGELGEIKIHTLVGPGIGSCQTWANFLIKIQKFS